MGMWYPKDAGCDLTAFADADHAGCQDSRKSTSGSAQFLDEKLCNTIGRNTLLSDTILSRNKLKMRLLNSTLSRLLISWRIFTKALVREHFKFLVKSLGMQSITPEELKLLVESKKDEE
ncbi:hypothetical protein Tco_1233003 [Tanacetum coccineum]